MSDYLEDLRSPKWQKKRLEIMQRAGWKCELCINAEENLQIHHKKYISGHKPWEYENDLLICLCESCHKLISNKNKQKIQPEQKTSETIEDDFSADIDGAYLERTKISIQNSIRSIEKCRIYLKDFSLPKITKDDLEKRILSEERKQKRIEILQAIQIAERNNDFEKASILSREFNQYIGCGEK